MCEIFEISKISRTSLAPKDILGSGQNLTFCFSVCHITHLGGGNFSTMTAIQLAGCLLRALSFAAAKVNPIPTHSKNREASENLAELSRQIYLCPRKRRFRQRGQSCTR